MIIQGKWKQSGCSGFGWTTISQGKNKIPFYKNQVKNKSGSVIFWLTKLTIIDRKAYQHMQDYQPPMHVLNLLLYSQGTLLCKKLSNAQSGIVITAHTFI